MKKTIIIMMLLLFVASCTNSEQVNTKGPVTLGVIMPLSGEAAVYGEFTKDVYELARKEINAAGGINGRSLQLQYEDGGFSAKGGLTSAQKLVNVNHQDILLVWSSGEVMGVAPFAQEQEVIVFSSSAGSPEITTAGDYIFRNFPSDATSGSKIAQVAFSRGDKKMALISEQSAYAHALVQVFKEQYEGEIVFEETLALDTTDAKTTLAKVKASGADGVYLVGATPQLYRTLLRQMQELDVDMHLYGNELLASQDFLKEFSSFIEGSIYAEPAFDEQRGESKALLNKIKEKYGEVSGVLPPIYSATAYDAIYIMKEAIEECGGTQPVCIKTQLYGISGREGAAGVLSIDSNGDPLFSYEVKTIENGKVVAYT